MHGLAQTHRVIAADYEGHRMAHPAPETLTPGNVAADLLAIADAGGAADFAYYGYSWLALSGLQLALRTDRLWALVMGGYPPMGGPYQAMLAVTRAAHAMSSPPTNGTASDWADVTPGDWDAVSIQTTEAQTRQFVTLYEALDGFDDTAAVLPATCRGSRLPARTTRSTTVRTGAMFGCASALRWRHTRMPSPRPAGTCRCCPASTT